MRITQTYIVDISDIAKIFGNTRPIYREASNDNIRIMWEEIKNSDSSPSEEQTMCDMEID